MKYKGIIFDLDGVICSTDNFHYKAWKTLAHKLQIEFDQNKNNLLRGVSRMESLEIILGEKTSNFTEKEKNALAEEKNNIYRKSLEQMSPKNLSIDVKKTLLDLRAKGYKLAIGSSSKNARFILQKLGITEIFHEIVDGTDIEKSKPDPEVFLKAAAKLGLDVKDCVVVEDAIAGIKAGLAGGFQVIGIGDATKSNLISSKLNKFMDLLDYV